MTSTPSTSATKKEEEKALALANAEALLPAADRWLTPDLEAMARRMGEGGNYWDLRAA